MPTRFFSNDSITLYLPFLSLISLKLPLKLPTYPSIGSGLYPFTPRNVGFFFPTPDGLFAIKTIFKSEFYAMCPSPIT